MVVMGQTSNIFLSLALLNTESEAERTASICWRLRSKKIANLFTARDCFCREKYNVFLQQLPVELQ